MAGWIKKSLLAAALFGACWGGAVWYWRASNRMPSTADVVLFMLVLPLGLLLAFWLGSRLIALMAAAPAAAAVPAPAEPQPAPSAPAPGAAPLAILASSLRAPHGASPGDLSSALAGNKARADLDAELVDDDGFPVMTARSSDADDSGLQEKIAEWLAQNGMPDVRFHPEQWRALVMGSAVAAELASFASADLLPPESQAPALQLVPVLPPDWRLEQRVAAGQWLRHLAVRSGWPAQQVVLAAELPSDAGAATPLSALARLAQHAAGGAPLVAIMVACGSHLGEESISQWSGRGTLFTSSRPQGLIPGEGAAGLLLTDFAMAQSIEGAAIAMLHTVDEARRHNSADEARRTDAELLGTLTEKVLARGAAQPSDVAMLIADTGHRTSRVLELMGLASASLPQLDADADVMRLGAGSGTCGAVPFMTALALSHHHAVERDAPVLCISNEDPYRRSAALVRPPASQS